jgi:hypothetical protein
LEQSLARKKFVDGNIGGAIYGEVGAFKGVLSIQEHYCAWIGAQSTTSALFGVGYNHVKACTDPNFKIYLENVKWSSTKALDWDKKFLLDVWTKGWKEVALEESKKNNKKVFIH